MPQVKIKTLGDYLNWAQVQLGQGKLYFGHGTDNPWDEAVAIAVAVLEDLPLNASRAALAIKLHKVDVDRLLNITFERIHTKKPLGYILGEVWYAGYKFKVSCDTLIPRSGMFNLLQNNFAQIYPTTPRTMLDLCTGSGCLAIIAAHEFNCDVDAIDISAEALKIAQANVALHNLTDKITLIKSDGFATIEPKHQYDVIISNPPYVGQQEMQSLPKEYQWEPQIALRSGTDGLQLTHYILANAAKYLSASGVLLVEVGNSWQELERQYPKVTFNWLTPEVGGFGIFWFKREQLIEYKQYFNK